MFLPAPSVHTSLVRSIISVRKLDSTSVRLFWSHQGWWIEDHKSRPWPRSERERKAAAARYGLRDGDYKPVKEDLGIGDYPNLGNINFGVKDPYEDWSMDKYRRNFGEAVPWDFDMTTPDKYTYTQIEANQVKGWPFWKRYLIWFGSLFGFIYVCFEFPIRMLLPMKPKQYAYDYNYAWPTFDPKLFPITNYTFEPADG